MFEFVVPRFMRVERWFALAFSAPHSASLGSIENHSLKPIIPHHCLSKPEFDPILAHLRSQ